MRFRTWARRIGLGLVAVAWLLAAPIVAEAACTGASPTWTTTPDLASVAACVAGASAYDTINVTAGDGSETWSSTLTITKGINLIGPGAANLTITSTATGDGTTGFAIIYAPADASANAPFRLSGFTITTATAAVLLLRAADDSVTPQTNVRVDHNVLSSSFSGVPRQVISVSGMYGVADHNTLSSSYVFRFASADNDKDRWDNWTGLVYGAWDNNFYIEDNAISTSDGGIADCQDSNRYAFRYNDITNAIDATPLLDLHGNQGEGNMYACFGSEVYGNDVALATFGYFDFRGGKNVTYVNRFTGNLATVGYREEYCDALNPTSNPQPQHVSSSYNWSNLDNGGSDLVVGSLRDSATTCEGYTLAANQDWWDHSLTYDGSTPGVGCGTTLTATCTTGDGYWLTAQSCTSIASHVGVSPSAPISGTFYRCKATNTWSSEVADGGFVPLAYPHPFLSVPAAPSSFTPTQIEGAVYLQWAHSGVGVTHYRTVVDSTTTAIVGEPLVSGTATTYRTALPALAGGQHTVRVDACNWEGCTATAEIIVVKL
jgi:hypothetical protein